MIKELLSRAFIISNIELDVNFDNKMFSKVGNYYVTTFKLDNTLPTKMEYCRICFRSMNVRESKDCVEYGALISNNTIKIRNNQMNTRDIYYIYEPEKNIFVVFNQLLLAKQILEACGLEVRYSNVKIYENGSYFKHIKQMNYAEILTVENKNNVITCSYASEEDILENTEEDNTYTLETSMKNYYEKLYEATKRLTSESTEISIPLSGGIDSGAIAYLLTQLNKNVSAYSIGTEWGNEFEDAASTANYIGVNLRQIFISREDIFREIPNVIAAFGFNMENNIEISLIPQCLFRKIKEEQGNKEILFATGFGSDLLNAGIFTPFNEYEELRNEIVTILKKTRMPNETYSNLFFQNNSMFHNINVVHPFWEPSVIEEALRIPTKFKVVDNKDKYFFRKLMETKMGMKNCWRKKTAAHHGTGIGFNLMNALSNGNKDFTREDYENYFKNIHEQIFYKNDFSLLK